MYAGVNSGVSTLESDGSLDIPEWKKILIMKKRAVCNPGADEPAPRRNLDCGNVNTVRSGMSSCESFGVAGGINNKFYGSRSTKVEESDVSPPKTVTIGNINIELRSVKPVDIPPSLPEVPGRNLSGEFDGGEVERDYCEDLRYGPGIVDRLRNRFLNIGVKQQCKPVVRRFSSLENLPGCQGGPYRVNARRQNGMKSGNVKKAQSMETLLCTSSEQHLFTAGKRPRAVSGVKARILSRNVAPISVFSDENDKPKEKSPSPAVSPRFYTKSTRRWDYGRSVSAPNINEDELPKPDTVKHVKKIFESPPAGDSDKGQRFRKISTPPPPTPVCNGAIAGSAAKKVFEEGAKPICAKESCLLPTPEESSDHLLSDSSMLLEADKRSCEAAKSSSTVTPEQSEQCHKHSDALSQGKRDSSSAELIQDEEPPPLPSHRTSSLEDGMVVASAAATSTGDSYLPKKGAPTWQKPPHSTTSIVFDFRGRKDVEAHIALTPAPFGCRPAKVSRSSTSKRSGSPPRSPVNGDPDFVEESYRNEDEEDWDEMDIGADLPAFSGIVFVGENIRIGKGAFLEVRNKKLNIQFDDKATSTFEYPSENTCPSPSEENCDLPDSFDSKTAMGSAANSRLGLSNYTPQVLSSNHEFELGISQPNLRKTAMSPEQTEHEDVPILDVIIPADPCDTGGWSTTETTDILF